MQETTERAFVTRLERHGPLSGLAAEALGRIPLMPRHLKAGDYIVREADAPSLCGILISGFAYRQKMTGHGLRQILAICIPGEIVDLQNLYLGVADHSVQMLTGGEAVLFARSELQRVAAAEATVARALLIEALLEAAILREWIVNIGRRKAKTRIAHLLCEFAIRLNATAVSAKAEFDLPMNQEHLGDALGMTSVHLNRQLRELVREGVVAWSKKTVRILDWDRLREAGDFDGRYLHQDLAYPSYATDRLGSS